MQRDRLILGTSAVALLTCALAYGCAGKSTTAGSSSTAGSSNVGDGSAHVDGSTHGDGISPGTSGTCTAGFPCGDGSRVEGYSVDGSYIGGDGAVHGDGSYIGGDGYDPTCCDAGDGESPHHGDGDRGDGNPGRGDGDPTWYADGHGADGFSDP